MRQALTYVEIDVDRCALEYGEAPCMAEIGVTGERKCFKSLRTCQDRVNFDNAPVTLRFAKDCGHLPDDIEAIPSLVDYIYTPCVVSLGEDLGQRSSLTVTFRDHPHSDTGPAGDPYWRERGYDPWTQGTFWGRFRARQPYLRGRAIRLIVGFVGQALEEMETRHLIIESFDGPTPDGAFRIVAKDALKLADGDRALAPRPSNGFLTADIGAGATSLPLGPPGVGDGEYPDSGWAAIGGKEVIGFTRSGDSMSITRGLFGTAPQEHSAQDRVQLCLRYQALNPATIIQDLLVTYAGVDPDYIPAQAWQTEVEAFLRRLYSAVIAEPTPVNALVSELIQQAALAVWWADRSREIRLSVLRAIVTDTAVFDRSNVVAGSLGLREQPDKRISQVWTHFGLINPLGSVDDPSNYRASVLVIDGQSETDYGSPATKRIFARWIPAFGRQVALRTGALQLGRFRDAPRRFTFSVFRGGGGEGESGAAQPVLGAGYRLLGQPMQTETGEPEDVPIQVTRIRPGEADLDIEAEEMRFISFDEDDFTGRVLVIDATTWTFNLRAAHDQIYPAPVAGDEVTCIVEAGVLVGASSTQVPAFHVGDWPAGVTIRLVVRGRVQGAGGAGGRGCQIYYVEDGIHGLPAGAGHPGGAALYTRYPVTLVWEGGAIWGGGGGGGGGGEGMTSDGVGLSSGGGGGAGQGNVAAIGGPGGNSIGPYVAEPGGPSTVNAIGLGGRGAGLQTDNRGGHGGTAGNPGNPGLRHTFTVGGANPGGGGAAGYAINGAAFVTVQGSGDFRGPTI